MCSSVICSVTFWKGEEIIVYISSVVHISSVPTKSRKNARQCLLQMSFIYNFSVAYEMDITIPGLVIQKLKRKKKERNLENLISLSKSHIVSNGRTSRFKFKLEREKGGGGWKEGRRKNTKNFGNGGQNSRKKKDQLNYLENH